MAVYVLTGKFVGDGGLAIRGGRRFAAFKPPGGQRNTLYEVHITNGVVALTAIGMVPGTWYKSGACALAFNDQTNELEVFSTESANPATGGDAQPVLWTTGIFIAPIGGGGASDPSVALRLDNHELRLDRIAAGAAG